MLKRWQASVLTALLVGSSVALAWDRTKVDLGNIATKKGVLSVWAAWIKDKGKKFDIDFHFRNESDKFIVILTNDLECMRGKAIGTVKGERPIGLSPEQSKDVVLTCTFGAEVTGDVKITVRRVYDNPTSDRSTPGKIIAKDIAWNQSGSSTSAPAEPAPAASATPPPAKTGN